ncbi:DUF3095 domain-containing protein [Hoeflea sp. WL0058]|uniref:DUF3095 domain-containing protein n=1 Tax=Flavimaribacter sediminis TaxID=2865987 RepID=A0AAE2ZJ84_9HYPH|nr:DUF3095 domain-containing protein [Flavimaribacter sediminis]MBW8637759.1 DUF3095 domain-containing protein [Flavimaribacter sediminis]
METFYDRLVVHDDFETMSLIKTYAPLPDDWFVGVADVVGSTGEIERGRYKVVNTVGAAVISAQINAAGALRFPYIFGGDGAAFALPGDHRDTAEKALAAVIRWAREEFDLEMRGAVIPVATIRDNGLDVAVARYRASKGVDYAMFAGGGMAWADREMKEGSFRLEAAPAGVRPDLTGLSCRWTPVRAQKGNILSLLVLPEKDADAEELARLYRNIVAVEESLERAGHPVPESGPGYRWPPEGLDLEVAATRGKTSFAVHKMKLLAATFIALIFFKTGWKAGAFDPKEYVEVTAANADFRKFDDGLKMTIDCDAKTQAQLTALLKKASEAGLIRYGLSEQPEAIMTCIVPSVTRNDHVHFVDGAGGGYTRAASLMKEANPGPA